VPWGVVHNFFRIGFRKSGGGVPNWVWAWLTYGRGARLITGEVSILIQCKLARLRNVSARS
jgi:hypothetical protein